MSERLVLAFSGKGENDAIRGMIEAYGDALATFGIAVVHITQEPAELQYAVEQIAAGTVSFAMTWLGIAQDLSIRGAADSTPRNVWEEFDLPLVKFQGDIPAYFADFHGDKPTTSINLYCAEEFLQFRHKWLSWATSTAALIPPLPLDLRKVEEVKPSTRRSGKLVFLKNGNSPEELEQLWRERLPQSVSRLVREMADEAASMALRPGKFLVGDLVSRHLESRSFDVRTVLRLVPFFSAQLDDYVRRVKSKLIAEAIIDLPVVVQGRNWNHLDFTGHRATWAAGQDYVATRKLYLDQLGIIDMSPNVDTSPHERVQRAAGSYCLPLTNRQGWHRDLFPEFEDLLFDFDPESIRDRVAGAIAHPDRFVELGIEFGERFRERYPPARFAERLLDIVDVANLQIGKNKPFIQPYFAWPSQAN